MSSIRRGVAFDAAYPPTDGVNPGAPYGLYARTPEGTTQPARPARAVLPNSLEDVVIRSIRWSIMLGTFIGNDGVDDVVMPARLTGALLMVAREGSDLNSVPFARDTTSADQDDIPYHTWVTQQEGEIIFEDRGMDGYPSGLVIPGGRGRSYAVLLGTPFIQPDGRADMAWFDVSTRAGRPAGQSTLTVRYDVIPTPYTQKGSLLQRSAP